MENRRKSKRTLMETNLTITGMNGQEPKEVAIEIVDVSKEGIGFVSKDILPIGGMYETYLTIWTKEVIHAFLRIVRIELKEEGCYYGASFVGMPELDAKRIEVYQSFNDDEE